MYYNFASDVCVSLESTCWWFFCLLVSCWVFLLYTAVNCDLEGVCVNVCVCMRTCVFALNQRPLLKHQLEKAKVNSSCTAADTGKCAIHHLQVHH